MKPVLSHFRSALGRIAVFAAALTTLGCQQIAGIEEAEVDETFRPDLTLPRGVQFRSRTCSEAVNIEPRKLQVCLFLVGCDLYEHASIADCLYVEPDRFQDAARCEQSSLTCEDFQSCMEVDGYWDPLPTYAECDPSNWGDVSCRGSTLQLCDEYAGRVQYECGNAELGCTENRRLGPECLADGCDPDEPCVEACIGQNVAHICMGGAKLEVDCNAFGSSSCYESILFDGRPYAACAY